MAALLALATCLPLTPAPAAQPTEPGDGSPRPPCVDVGLAVGQPKLELRDLPLRGCTVEISAGASKIQVIQGLCHDPVFYDLRPSVPVAWELVSWPGNPRPAFAGDSTLATLSLPRTGTYRVRFTICPAGSCPFQPHPGGDSYPLRLASDEITIVAVNTLPVPAEKYPVLPPSATVATQPTGFPDKSCQCQGGGGFVDPQWVTTENWSGPADYQKLEGAVFKSWVSRNDNFLNHDSHDVNFSVIPDGPFRFLLSTEPEFDFSTLLGVEWERASYPERLRPSYGDRVSLFGFWILDCGHPPFYTEIHPPVGVAVHRSRPIALPADRSFTFRFPEGNVVSTVGNDVYVPGIRTEIWFNRNAGETTRNCSDTGLHQPGVCTDCDLPPTLCPPWLGGDCIRGRVPIEREYEFNIYLPRNPAVNARDQGLDLPSPPLYIAVSNPWGHAGPDPVVTPVTEGDVTYLRVRLDLRGFSGDTYARRIESAWVHPAPDNWGLRRWRVTFRTLDVHDDHDPWTDWPYDDGDWRFWINLNNRDQEWTRILDGDENAHGTMTFTPPWETGAGDSAFWRGTGALDPDRRLGPDVLSYPGQGVYIGTTAFDSDTLVGDDAGRVSTRLLSAGTRLFRSSNGSYSIEVDVQPGPALNRPTLTSTARRLYDLYQITCDNGPPLPPVRPVWTHPLEVAGFLTPGIADRPPWRVEGEAAIAQLGTAVAGVGDVNGDGFDDLLVGAPRRGANFRDAGRVALYLGYPGDLSSAPFWTLDGDRTGAWLGLSVAAAGDVNDDGYADFLAGAPGYANGQENEGAAFLWLGGGTNLETAPAHGDWMAEGDRAGASFGYTVAPAGDVNSDGFDDVIVGAPFYVNITGQPLQGRASIYLGSATGLAQAAQRHLFAPLFIAGSEHQFGSAVASAGDVNGDGFGDVIVGAPRYSKDRPNEGAAFVYLGSANGIPQFPAWTVEGNVSGALFGAAVAPAGDVNGDGFDDVLVGAPGLFLDDVQRDIGAVMLFLGSRHGLATKPAWTQFGSVGGARLGAAVAGVGDLNGDGLDDAVVGAPGFSDRQNQEGRISVYLGTTQGTGLAETPTWTTAGHRLQAHFGAAVAAAGDPNHDGTADFLVGAPGYTHGQNAEGAAFVYFGCRPREIQPASSRFFRSVGPEQFVLFNLVATNFQQLLNASQQTNTAKLDAMLVALRQELEADILGTPREPDALAMLETLRDLVPPDLWQQRLGDLRLETGGALYLDCGASTSTRDAAGRQWKPDEPFLVVPDSHVASFNQQPVNASLLSDSRIPNNVLLGERWRDGDLRYEIPVRNGPHTAILYFSENCGACVNPDLGGTGPPGTARLFDLEVEGQRVNGYNPADTALPPMGDGRGATFKATQLVFREVNVTDGLLNVNVLDRGPGNPPENAAIKAMAILQQASATGLVPPHFVSARQRGEDIVLILDPGPNLAAYLSGLAEFELSQSTDLRTWSPAGQPTGLSGTHVLFVRPLDQSARFYRAAVRQTKAAR